jgi:hypothetical protein
MAKEVEIVVEDDGKPSAENREVAIRETPSVPMHAMERTADEIVARLDKIREVQKRAMSEGTDYGVIPGTERKVKDSSGKDVDISPRTLLKAGAEKLCVLFNLDAQFTGDGNSEQMVTKTYEVNGKTEKVEHLIVKRYCTIYSQASGARLGGASAMCSTLESKYQFRKGQRFCPKCNKPALIHTKRNPNDWWCSKYMDGCSENFQGDDPRIVNQQVGDIPNLKVADQFNTAIRIAEKRALVASVRLVTGASAIFDEEMPDEDVDANKATPAAEDKGSETKSEKKPAPKSRPTSEKAAEGTGTQGNPNHSAQASNGSAVGQGDKPKPAPAPKSGTVTPEQAQELTELFDNIPLGPSETREQKLARTLRMVSAPIDGDFSGVPAPNFNVLKQMLNKQIENAAKA